MKPLPAQQAAVIKKSGESMPSLPAPSATAAGSYSTANRRANSGAAQRAYPWLLFASTATAGLFCLLYITKPVLPPVSQANQAPVTPVLAKSGNTARATSLIPDSNRLPGETGSQAAVKPVATDPRHALPEPPSSSAYEETNLRIQHILTAEAPGGQLDRIDIDVPVLYHSRNLRWKSEEVAQARELLIRLMDYQDKSRQLRSEGIGLLDAWNQLISSSIPATELRADSPSLPENQEDAADAPRPAGFISTEAIQIQTSGK